MEIKEATKKDTVKISYLINKSTDKNPNNYSKEQIAAWKKYNTPSKIKTRLNHQIIFCAFDKNKLVGTITLKADSILSFYVSYSIRKKGIGSILLNHLENYALHKGIDTLRLTATPSALHFYKNRGYKPNKNVVISIFGIDYPEVEMQKNIVS